MKYIVNNNSLTEKNKEIVPHYIHTKRKVVFRTRRIVDKNNNVVYEIISINGLNDHLMKLFNNTNIIFTNITRAAEMSIVENAKLRENDFYTLYIDLDIFENNWTCFGDIYATIYRIKKTDNSNVNGFKPLTYRTNTLYGKKICW